MTNIVRFPTAKSDDYPVKTTPTMGEVLWADIQEMPNFDYRNEWANSIPFQKKTGMTTKELLDHDVKITDITNAISITFVLKEDQEAADYFRGLLDELMASRRLTLKLAEIPTQFRGYVWSLNFYNIIKSKAYVEHQLSRIIGKPINRYAFF